MTMHPYYTANNRFLKSKVNRTFGEICFMSNPAFRDWVKELRSALRRDWVHRGLPPKAGIDEPEIVNRLQAVTNLDVDFFLCADDQTLKKDCLFNTHKGLNGADSFFPNMGKMRETKGIGDTGLSQFDLIADAKHLDQLEQFLHRQFKRDGRFSFSKRAKKNSSREHLFSVASGSAWIREFSKATPRGFDFFIEPKTSRKRHGTGGYLTLSAKDARELVEKGTLKRRHLVRLKLADFQDSDRFFVRHFRKDQRIFPKGYVAFKSGLVHMGTNFPAATAKYLYERFTADLVRQKRIVVYDPSAGYGGRLVGALATAADRPIHYVGTDPNPDHWLPEQRASRYDYLASFHQEYVRQEGRATWDTYRIGSEVIQKNAQFKKYKGKVDLVFTSPPYFSAEAYSDDKNQSCVKFPEYDQWKENFLRPTLETAVRWLKRDRYLLWNIADTKIGAHMYPLENDSIEILESLGMVWQDTLKMVLARAPGSNRTGRYRYPTTKNFCSVGGSVYKYEPIFVFKKPGK